MNQQRSSIDRRIKKSKAAMHRALLELMGDKEFKAISIKEIVVRADVNRGTFYKHYQYKEQLLEEIIDDVLMDLKAAYREPYKSDGLLEITNLTTSSIKIFEHVAKHASFYSLVVEANALAGFQQKLVAVIRNLALQDLIPVKEKAELNRRLQASYHSYAILGMVVEWVKEGFLYSPAYMAEQLLLILRSWPEDAMVKARK